MSARSQDRPAKAPRLTGPVWTRQPEPEPQRLTLEAILTTAIHLADTKGLDAVTIRRVAAELNARPMSLYSFFSRKDDLVDLMLDKVIGEARVPNLPPDWQEALRAIAHGTRNLGLNHPWVMVLLSRRPALGPNRIRNVEQSLAAVSGLGIDIGRLRALLLAVDTYTIGATAMAVAAKHMQQRDGLTDAEWQAAAEAYLGRLTETGDFPHLRQLGNPTSMWRSDLGDVFDDGLNWLLAGFAATLPEAPPAQSR